FEDHPPDPPGIATIQAAMQRQFDSKGAGWVAGIMLVFAIGSHPRPAEAGGGDCPAMPDCAGGIPRVMVLLDASSSMLNINGSSVAGGPWETGWDQVRDSLTGPLSIFEFQPELGLEVGDV